MSAFLPVVFILYHCLPSLKWRNALLIAASLLFYAYGEPVYIVLMLFSIVCNWFFGLKMESPARNGWLTAAVIVNIGLLFVFKYLDMFLGGVNALTGLQIPLAHLSLPVGISFFTFQALSYVIDVWRRDTAPQKNLFYVMLYISFFPQLIAGPIVKYHDIARQIEERTTTPEQTARGFRRFCTGLAKKVLLANTMAVCADAVYALPAAALSAPSAWLGALAYCLQIYFDFSGYSDMAIGMGHLFGFTFQENFRYPYAAASMKEFWRRWHISLTSWFTQYVYIPLGGSRRGKVRTWLNKLLVFLLSGLWHGANLTFVLWGAWNGLSVLLEDWIPVKKWPGWLGHLYVILIFTLGFAMFRADTISQGLAFIQTMFTGFAMDPLQVQSFVLMLNPLFLVSFGLAVVCSTPVFKTLGQRMESTIGCGTPMLYCGSLVLLILSMLSLASGTYNPFIYFRF